MKYETELDRNFLSSHGLDENNSSWNSSWKIVSQDQRIILPSPLEASLVETVQVKWSGNFGKFSPSLVLGGNVCSSKSLENSGEEVNITDLALSREPVLTESVFRVSAPKHMTPSKPKHRLLLLTELR